MQPPTSESHVRQVQSSQDLPYGALPVRAGRHADPSGSPSLDHLVNPSWLSLGDPSLQEATANAPDSVPREAVSPGRGGDETANTPPATGHADVRATDEDVAAGERDDLDVGGGDTTAESAGALSRTSPRPEADDDVHFGVAARALGVSRKTVERMVKRGQLARGPSNGPATVSKRTLVAALEARRRDVSHLTRANEIEQSQAAGEYPSASPEAAMSALTEFAPVLTPLLDEVVAARTRAAVLESLKARAGQDRARDELLVALATTNSWWGRRRTRQAVLRQYVLGERPDSG
jgi:hypothetical protein